ncbi:MAG: copper-binding protein [Pseudomonadota bacterium]
MVKFLKLATRAVPMLALIAAPAVAQDKKMDHSGHGSMKMEAPANVTEAEAKAKINTVDSEGGKVNVTHAPVPELGWPTMTMDLPVTRRVDLSAVKPGADVTIKLKKGRDNQFRIIGITPAE